jgi:hypothetical protein
MTHTLIGAETHTARLADHARTDRGALGTSLWGVSQVNHRAEKNSVL